MKNSPLVSVCMITYNHEKYIDKALKSVLCQKTNFEYEIVIGDDFSNDKTSKILKEYVEKYPNIIKLIIRKENIGIAANFADSIFNCNGKYVAILEGDDYWIDENKLQKQFDLLEKNLLYSLCYSNCKEVNEITQISEIVCENRPKKVDLNYLLSEGWFMRTPTLFFRRSCLTKFPDWYYTAYSTDYILQVMLLTKGPAIKIDEELAVYRKHVKGISAVSPHKQLKMWEQKLNLLKIINHFFEKKYKQEIKKQSSKLYFQVLKFSIKNRIFNKIFIEAIFRFSTLRYFLKYLIKLI